MNTTIVAAMIIIATLALLMNGISVWLFLLARNADKNINRDDNRVRLIHSFYTLQLFGLLLSALIIVFLVPATYDQGCSALLLLIICLAIPGTLIGILTSVAFLLIRQGKLNNVFFKNWFVKNFL